MLNTISQVFGTSREMVTHHVVRTYFGRPTLTLLQQRAILESVAAEFGVDSLPPMYRLEEFEGAEEPAAAPAPLPEANDQGEETGNDSVAIFASSPEIDDEHTLENLEEDEGWDPAPLDPESVVPPRQPAANSSLDPTIPEFVPSFLRASTSQLPGPSYELDWLRPLPSGPSTASGSQLAEQPEELASRSDIHSQLQGVRSATSYLRGRIDAINALILQESSPPTPPFDASTLLLNPPSSDAQAPPATAQQDAPADVQPAASEPALVQDADPPFMTDGRGRVVWSSTTSSRGREGRRGRAASSSAMVPPHLKSSPDVLAPEDRAAPSRHDSPAQRTSQRLIRQRSLPSVGPSSDIEELEVPRPAEFVTDGRGRVVFASLNDDR